MSTFLNPVGDLDDLIGFFEIAADEGGTTIDATLCQTFVEGLADIAEKLEALVAFARASGLVQTIEADAPRTPIERRRLARAMLNAAGPDARVIPMLGGAA